MTYMEQLSVSLFIAWFLMALPVEMFIKRHITRR